MPDLSIAEQTIHYREMGSGPTLLIFPDNLHSSQAYVKEIEYFSETFHVISFDYPGCGKSTRDVKYQDERQYDLWNYFADFASHLLLELEVEACHAMGAGLGALPALHFAGKQAALHDIRVRGLVADSFTCDLDPRTLHRWLDVREHYYVRNAKRLHEEHGEDWREVLEADTDFLRRLGRRGGYQVHEALFNAVSCPVMLTGNFKDTRIPDIGREFARLSRLIPDCSMYLASKSGHRYAEEHPLMWTDPGTFRAVCDVFFSQIRQSSGEK